MTSVPLGHHVTAETMRVAKALLLPLLLPAVSARSDLSRETQAGRVVSRLSAQPQLKLRKRLIAFGRVLAIGCDYRLHDKAVAYEVCWRRSVLGGDVSLRNLDSLEWRKLWILPGARETTDSMHSLILVSRCYRPHRRRDEDRAALVVRREDTSGRRANQAGTSAQVPSTITLRVSRWCRLT